MKTNLTIAFKDLDDVAREHLQNTRKSLKLLFEKLVKKT